MKLWRVSFEGDVIVAAEDFESAFDEARRAVERDVSEGGESMDVHVHDDPIEKLADLPAGWNGECLPYGDGDGNTRIKDFLK